MNELDVACHVIEGLEAEISQQKAELARLRLVAKDARALMDSIDENTWRQPSSATVTALAESLAAYERGQDVDEENLFK